MKKIFYIIVGLFTFSIGFWSYLSRPFITPVSLCEISQNTEIYRSKSIKIKANLDQVLIRSGEENEYSVSDLNSDCLTGATLEPSEKLKLQLQNDENLKNFINELSEKQRKMYEKRDSSGFYLAEIEIVGEIEKREPSSYGSLVEPPPFIIKAEQIKQVSPIKFITTEEFLKITKNIRQ